MFFNFSAQESSTLCNSDCWKYISEVHLVKEIIKKKKIWIQYFQLNVFKVIFPHLTLVLAQVLFPLSLFHFKSRFHLMSLDPKHVCLLMMISLIGVVIFKLSWYSLIRWVFSKFSRSFNEVLLLLILVQSLDAPLLLYEYDWMLLMSY